MFLINYLFSSSVTFRRDYFIQFNRIAILALQYSITLHIKSFLMCSGNISLHGGFHVSSGGSLSGPRRFQPPQVAAETIFIPAFIFFYLL